MNARWIGVVMVALWSLSLQATEPPDAAALVERAIEYHGGRGALESWPHIESRGSYEMAGRMAGRSADVFDRQRADGAYRREVTFEFGTRKFTMTEIFDHAMRKRRFGVGWDDLPVDEPRDEAEHRHAFLLRASEREPAIVGDGSEADVGVWYVEVPDGRGTARLGLAKDDARLVSLGYPGVKAEGMGTKEEITRKSIDRDFRSVGSLRLPFDLEFFEDGTPVGRWRVEEMTVLTDYDGTWLEIPDPTDRFIPSEELVY